MEGEGRTRRHLTPLGEELRAPAGWTPPGPVAEEYKPKRLSKGPPKTVKGMIGRGLLRFGVILGGLGGSTALVAYLIDRSSESSAAKIFPLVFYVVGALIAGSAVMVTTTSAGVVLEDSSIRGEREERISSSFVTIAVGVSIIAVGVALEVVL
jgi:hypothetical protein